MTSRFIPLRAAALLAVLLPFQSSVRADTDFGQVAIYVAHMLENTHISHKVFDNELSAKVLDSYLDFLDARHQIFTQQDVDGFRASYKDTLDDSVMLRDISPAVKIYEVYKQRVKERVDFARKTLEKPEVFTFDSDRSVDLKREKLPWPKDQAAADGLWRDLIEAEMLSEIMSDEAKATDKAKKAKKAADKPKAKDGETVKKAEDPEEPPAKRVLKDYERLIKNIADNKDEEVVNFFLSCLAMSYDPHTEYFSVSEMDSFNTSMRHELIGIGAMLKVDDDVAKIQGLVVGGPADKSGLLALDDKIIAVGQDGEAWVDTKYLQLNKIVDMIRGKEGSTVHLRIVPADDPSTTREINIVRAKVSLKDNVATADLLETPGAKGESMRVGWISLASFYADMEGGGVSCTADVERLLRRLIKENINGLVLDLRGNGGGSLEEAIRMTGLFVPAGPVVQVKDWKDDIQFKECSNDRALYDGPMIVLTDKASASASEIVAAALQDYRRAVVIGDKSTYGKGTVQTVQPVDKFMPFFADKSRAGNVKVTIQKFYRIAGGSTQLKGVVPDLQLPSLRDAMDFGESSQKNALPYDEIPALPFTYARKDGFPTDQLKSRLETRVKGNADFAYIADEAVRLKKRIERDTVSLNKATREKELKDSETRRDAFEADRDTRAKAANGPAGENKFKVYHLTQDNVNKPELVLETAFTNEMRNGMKQTKAEDDDEDDTPEAQKFPQGVEPARLECVNVLRDMIDLLGKGPAATAQASEKK